MNPALPSDPNRVEIRCEDCARDLGPAAPTLVVCRYTGPEGLAKGLSPWWDLMGLGQRRPTRAANTGPPPPDPPVQGVTGQAWLSGRTFDQNVLRGRAVQLTCRRCNAGAGADAGSYLRWPSGLRLPVLATPT
jgi:hypothetical protein